MLKLGETHDTLTVVDDQDRFAGRIRTIWRFCFVDMILTDKYGFYHATNEGLCTWYEFAAEIFRQAGMHVNVVPVGERRISCKGETPLQQPYEQRQAG